MAKNRIEIERINTDLLWALLLTWRAYEQEGRPPDWTFDGDVQKLRTVWDVADRWLETSAPIERGDRIGDAQSAQDGEVFPYNDEYVRLCWESWADAPIEKKRGTWTALFDEPSPF